jgi:hypothetical protein
MPSKEVYTFLLNSGISLEKSHFSKNDTLADKEDLDLLYEVLLSVRDIKGNPVVITPVVNVANPDFQKIKESEFSRYYYEPFTETLNRYKLHSETFNTWIRGIELGIFVPEFHGREHIAVHFWLRKLQEGDKKLRLAFDHEFVYVPSIGVPSLINDFRAGFYFNNVDQIEFLEKSIFEGVALFKDIFGYTPRILVPGNGIFHSQLEPSVGKAGIKYLYITPLSRIQGKKGKMKLKFYWPGRQSSYGFRYYTRNCSFEPTNPDFTGGDMTLKQIQLAFRMGKPAIISTHRVHFVGGINTSTREKGLNELSSLLRKIVKLWPETEFMSSAQMLKTLYPHD